MVLLADKVIMICRQYKSIPTFYEQDVSTEGKLNVILKDLGVGDDDVFPEQFAIVTEV